MPNQLQAKQRFLIIIRVIYGIFKISETIYSYLFGKFFFVAPLPYAIGNYCEDIKFALIAASIEKKKLVLLMPPMGIWQKLLSYKH